MRSRNILLLCALLIVAPWQLIAQNNLSVIASPSAGYNPFSLAINHMTNQVFAFSMGYTAPQLTIIDGSTNQATTSNIPISDAIGRHIGINESTGILYDEHGHAYNIASQTWTQYATLYSGSDLQVDQVHNRVYVSYLAGTCTTTSTACIKVYDVTNGSLNEVSIPCTYGPTGSYLDTSHNRLDVFCGDFGQSYGLIAFVNTNDFSVTSVNPINAPGTSPGTSGDLKYFGVNTALDQIYTYFDRIYTSAPYGLTTTYPSNLTVAGNLGFPVNGVATGPIIVDDVNGKVLVAVNNTCDLATQTCTYAPSYVANSPGGPAGTYNRPGFATSQQTEKSASRHEYYIAYGTANAVLAMKEDASGYYSVPTGTYPIAIVYNENNGKLYIANYNSDSVSIAE